VVDSLDGGQLEHEVREHRADAAADGLGDDVQAGVSGGHGAEESVDERDDRVEVGAGDRAEDEDQADERAGRGGGVLQELETHVVGGQAAGHDSRADDGDDQQRGAERLGGEAAGQVEAELAGAGLGLDREFGVGGVQRIDHDASVSLVEDRLDPVAQLGHGGVEGGLGAERDRVGDRPVQPGLVAGEFLVCPVTDRSPRGREVVRPSVSSRGAAPATSSPARLAAATAPGLTRSTGWVPAESPDSPRVRATVPQRVGCAPSSPYR
jgi:hypothetical protein